jgi:alpha-mannosidase
MEFPAKAGRGRAGALPGGGAGGLWLGGGLAAPGPGGLGRACDDGEMRIAGIESTDLFIGTPQRPLQVIRVTVLNEHPAVPSTAVHVHGAGVGNPEAFWIEGLADGEQRTVEVPIETAAPYQAGGTRRVTVEVDGDRQEADITLAEPGWTMWMVSHFHYDPVWWNTQGQFTESRLVMPDEEGRLPDVRTAFELVQVHLDKARKDPDYKFVLAEIDYLKPYLDTHPQDRADLRQLIAERRVEIVGGNYNEPSTNLTNAESTIRNAVYGIGYQRDVAGGDPRSAWMLDVFGHDPGYPGLMAAAGLTSSAWARGPFHQWGPAGAADGGVGRMQFPSEFEWVSPDGAGLLTHYMAHHYGAGWRLHTPADLESAEHEAHEQYRDLARVAATRNVMLPVGSDHVIPARWVTDIHRSWNAKYVWPRFVTAVPSEFFDAVRTGSLLNGAVFSPQTRDMNPVYTGKDVSCIDTKQAQRAIETAVSDAEALSTAAALAGAPYPHASLDKAWRLLAYGAHHDAITGVESDQVYLDLVGSWREAWDLADAARTTAAAYLGSGLTVVNGLARARDGVARVTVSGGFDGAQWLELRDAAGEPVPALATGVLRDAGGALREATLTFVARDVPALGHRTFTVVPAASSSATDEWLEVDGTVISSAAYQVTADPARGGTVRITDLRAGTDVLRAPGNELVLQEEYAQHPKHGEGPWHLSPRGPGLASGSVPAAVWVEQCPIGSRLMVRLNLDSLSVTQETLLLSGIERVQFRTHVDGSIGKDRLLRVRFPAEVPGGLPVYQTATAVIGRTFGAVDVDSAETWYTLDNPALGWFGLGSTARVRVSDGSLRAFGVAEIVVPSGPGLPDGTLRSLLVALAGAGVTATYSSADGSRYGDLDVDSNLPDVRIVLGDAESNPFSAAVLAAASPALGEALAAQLAATGTGRVWVPADKSRAEAFAPGADVRGVRDLPVLIVAGNLTRAVADLIGDLGDAEISSVTEAASPAPAPDDVLTDRSVAVFNRGTPSGVVTPDGTLHMSLMRSCSTWPSGIWIDGERRTAPDGSSFALQHWSHTFEYALASGEGDWRAAEFNACAEDYDHGLITVLADGGGTGSSALSVSPPNVTLSALKLAGNPLASGLSPDAAGTSAVTVRLRETDGRGCTAQLRVAGGIVSASLTDLLEETALASLPVADGTVAVEMSPFATATVVLQVPARCVPGEAETEPVQPVYARYWLHGKGPAPTGNLPAAVHLSPTRVALNPDTPSAVLTLTVAGGPEGASGVVSLVVPPELHVSPTGELSYDVPAGGHATWDVTVQGPDAAPGRYFVAARITDAAGQVIEDTVMVAAGEKLWPVRDLEPEDAMERMLADYSAAAGEVSLEVLTPDVELTPGGADSELVVRVTSQLASELRGEAQLVSPFGTWDLVAESSQAVVLAPGASTELRYALRARATARPGAHWWGLVKLMYFGRVWYTEAVPIIVAP